MAYPQHPVRTRRPISTIVRLGDLRQLQWFWPRPRAWLSTAKACEFVGHQP